MLASLCAPGYLLASVQFFHLETANFFLSMAILAPSCSLELSLVPRNFSFHLLSLLFNEKIGSFHPATASAVEHCPSFQCCSHCSNGSGEGRRAGKKGRQALSAWSLEEALPLHFFGLTFIPFSRVWPQR